MKHSRSSTVKPALRRFESGLRMSIRLCATFKSPHQMIGFFLSKSARNLRNSASHSSRNGSRTRPRLAFGISIIHWFLTSNFKCFIVIIEFLVTSINEIELFEFGANHSSFVIELFTIFNKRNILVN